jgi:putative ABC transport system substrate-binding protein
VNPANPNTETQSSEMQEAARAIGAQAQIVGASTESEIEMAFAAFANQRVDALVVAADLSLYEHREELVALAARYAIPAIYTVPRYASAGGLISYTSSMDIPSLNYQLGGYTGRILKGAKPAELPVVMSTRFQLVINLKTAKTLGLTVPRSILAQADEVIE